MDFVVKQDAFSGPLGLLLDLLNQRELEIKDVALAEIAEDYLGYLDAHEPPPDEMADFLVVASRLIYLKSRELMPYLRTEEEEEEVQKLEDQLRLYRMFVEAADKLEARFVSDARIVPRPFVKIEAAPEGFVMSENVTVDSLHGAMKGLLKKLEPFFALRQVHIDRVKSVQERIGELKGAIATRAKMRFKEVMHGAKNKAEVVVSFLALLELVKQRVVTATQSEDRDILIERV